MTRRGRQPRPAPEHEYVYWTAPRCPACDSRDLHTTRTDRGGDGSKTQHKVCRECFHAFRLVIE